MSACRLEVNFCPSIIQIFQWTMPREQGITRDLYQFRHTFSILFQLLLHLQHPRLTLRLAIRSILIPLVQPGRSTAFVVVPVPTLHTAIHLITTSGQGGITLDARLVREVPGALATLTAGGRVLVALTAFLVLQSEGACESFIEIDLLLMISPFLPVAPAKLGTRS